MPHHAAPSRLSAVCHACRFLWLGVAALCLRAAPVSAQSASALPALERAVDSLRPAGHSAAYARALLALASEYEDQARLEDATRTSRTAIAVATAVRDSATLGAAYHTLGLVHWSANRYDSSLVNLGAARRIRRVLPDSAALARTINTIGASYYQLAAYEPALDAFMRALELRRLINDIRGTATVLANIAKVYHDWGQRERARPVFEEAAALAEQANDPSTLGYVLNSLARLHIDEDNLSEARRAIERSVTAYAALDTTRSRSSYASGWSLNALAYALLDLREGRVGDGIARLDSLRQVAMERGSARGQAQALLHLGIAYAQRGDLARGDTARARALLSESLALSQRVDQRVFALEALAQLSALEERAGRSADALRLLRAHVALRDTIFNQAGAQRIAAMEARADAEREQRLNAALREEQRVQALVIARQHTAVTLGSVILLLAALVLGMLAYFMRKGRAREAALAQSNTDLAGANAELSSALSEVRTLKGLIPICSSCKSVRDDDGYWEAVETYIGSRSDAVFSHSICSACGPKLYGDHWPNDAAVSPPVGPSVQPS
jgi:tetratricopeptide (TPR) repeat protein